MGTDIHGFFQKYENNQWIDITTHYDERRHYYLFSALANQRKHSNLVAQVIAEPKGLLMVFTWMMIIAIKQIVWNCGKAKLI